MTKTKSTKRALLMSGLALIMCVSMLIGSTFAWFTDSVTSAGNKIQAGTLDIELWKVNSMMAETEQVKDEALFNYDLWEPGYAYATDLKLKNVGSLDAKFIMTIIPTEAVGELAEVIDVYYTVNDFYAWKMATQWSDASVLREAVKDEFVKLGTLKDVLDGTVKFPETAITAESEVFIQIAMVMQESAGNEYQGKSAGVFDLRILATQLTSEKDSFDNQYDKFADYDGEISNAVSLAAALKNGGTYKVINDIELDEQIIIPTGAESVLDMNGNDIIYNEESGVAIYSNGDLTLIGEGTVKSEAAAYAIRVQSGSLVIDSANIAVEGAFGAISVFNGAEVTINGGSYTNTGVAGKTSHVVYVGGYGTVNINGGTFIRGAGGDSGGVITGYGWENDAGEKAVININGGYIGSETAWGFISNYDVTWTDINITGGTYSQNPTKYLAEGYASVQNADGTYTVMKGVAASDDEGITDAIESGADTVVLAAGNYSLPNSVSGKTLSIVGTKETVININTAQGVNGANLTFDGVTIDGTTEDFKGLQHAGTIVYNNVTVTKGMTLYGEKVIFNNCEFELTSQYIRTYGAKNVEFNDCSFKTEGKAILIHQDGTEHLCTVTIKDCTFNATKRATTWDGIEVAAISIDGSNGTFIVNLEGTNTANDVFNGLWQIKKGEANVTVNE